jgi:TMEM175 potassium channel family protein
MGAAGTHADSLPAQACSPQMQQRPWDSVSTSGLQALKKVLEGTRGARPGRFRRASAVALPLRDGSVDAVVCDPPYDNLIDYAETGVGSLTPALRPPHRPPIYEEKPSGPAIGRPRRPTGAGPTASHGAGPGCRPRQRGSRRRNRTGMRRPNDRSGTRSDTRRAEAFSDGVLAIAITLLVLDLQSPKHEPGELLPALLRQWQSYLAYVTSFLYVGVTWLNHLAAFSRVASMDRVLHWANLGILFSIALLPFPTAVIADAVKTGNPADSRAAVGLYALVGVLVSGNWLLFFHHLSRRPDLVRPEVPKGRFATDRTRALVGVVLYTGAGAVGALFPPVALAIFFLLGVFFGLTSHGLAALPIVIRRGST